MSEEVTADPDNDIADNGVVPDPVAAEDDDRKSLDGNDDPILHQHPPNNVVREGDWLVLHFGDGRQVFCHCLLKQRGQNPCVKINRRSYPTHFMVGLPYGTVLEIQGNRLQPLPEGEELLPEFPQGLFEQQEEVNGSCSGSVSPQPPSSESTAVVASSIIGNRHLKDDNTSQKLSMEQVNELRATGTHGSAIVQKLVENSSTFAGKTRFSQAKYIQRKQRKHQPRCRIVRCTPRIVCDALWRKDPRKCQNLRPDTLGQILSYANVTAGCQVLVFDTLHGLVTGSLAQRMGGYGRILSIYEGQQPNHFVYLLEKFNLTFCEQQPLRWVHVEDVFGAERHKSAAEADDDPERLDRESIKWPCPLQPHTRRYLETEVDDPKPFLSKRCDRFARKLTRTSPLEAKATLNERESDSIIIIAGRHDPTTTLEMLWSFLGSSCPFVVYCEYLEPLTECFSSLQKAGKALNLRLMDTWMREYQILPNRTHPEMNMSQNGGFLLTGIKLDPMYGCGSKELDLPEEDRKRIREKRGPRHRHKKKRRKDGNGNNRRNQNKKQPNQGKKGQRPAKRAKKVET